MEVIARNGSLIDRMIMHRFPMARAQGAWEIQLQGKCGKVLLHPWD